MSVSQCVHSITQLTGLAVIIAEFLVATEWSKNINPSSLLPHDWLRDLILSSQLVPNINLSHPIGPPGVVAWLHQKLIHLRRALDVYCSTFTDGVRQPHTHVLAQEHTRI